MRLESLTVRGFMTAFAGKQVAINFAEMPDGLLAIVADNGAGKTTLLEAAPAGVFRQFMSRDGDLKTYAQDRDSFIESRWQIGDQRYRARLTVDGIKGGASAVLENGRPLNDGKVSTYDTAVAGIFPPLHVFKASAFAAQNKSGSFVRASKKDRRDIFNAFLNLDRLVAMSETAKAAAAEVEKVRVTVRYEIQNLEIATTAETGEALRAQITALGQDQCDAVGRRDSLAARIVEVEQRLATKGDDVAAHAAAQQRVTHTAELLAGKERELEALINAELAAGQAESRELNQLTIDHTRKSKSITDRASAATAAALDELQRIAVAVTANLTDIDTRLKGNADIQAMKASIETAVAELATLRPKLQALNAQADEHHAAYQRLTEELAAAEKALTAFTKPEAELARAKDDAALLGSVPCGGRDAFAVCQFLLNATAAAARIAELEVTVAGMVAAVEKRDRLTASQKDALQTYWTAKSSSGTTAKQINELELTAKYAEKLAASEARVQELQKQRVDVERDAADREREARNRHATTARQFVDEQELLDRELDDATAALRSRVDDRIEVAKSNQDAMARAVAAAKAVHAEAVMNLEALADGNHVVAQLRQELAALQADRDAAITAIATAASDAAAVERRLADLQEKAGRLVVLRGRLAKLETELLEWQLLQKALDRDGLPALEVDQAGPEISALTNQILADCFESRFSVELVTQVAKADGKGMKDEFTLLVTDNLIGQIRDIADLSGGEEVIVAEAFMNAISLYINARSTSPMRTWFRDETTGALTKENTQRYVRMLRKVQAMGNVSQIVFISHDPDAYALADAQIRVAGGEVSTALPPFAEAAA